GFTRFTGTIGFISMIPKIVVSFYAMRRYLERQLEVARESGGEGLIAELVRVEKNGGQVRRNGKGGVGLLLVFAGHETTTHLISGSDPEKSRIARVARRRLEPGQSRCRGIPAVPLAGAVHQAALRPQGARARRYPAEEGRADHCHAGGREPRSAGQCASGEA